MIERWPISTSAFGRSRDLMQSSQFWMCGRAIQPSPSHLSPARPDRARPSRSRPGWSRTVAIDFHLAFGADEDGAAHRAAFALETHRRAVGVSHRDDAVRAVGPELGRAGVVFAERPLDLIDAVRTPVGHLAAGVVAPLHPGELQLVVERPQLGGAAPGVPIVGLRDGFFGQGLRSVAGRGS